MKGKRNQSKEIKITAKFSNGVQKDTIKNKKQLKEVEDYCRSDRDFIKAKITYPTGAVETWTNEDYGQEFQLAKSFKSAVNVPKNKSVNKRTSRR